MRALVLVKKPLLLGMNNPHSDDPEFDLYPYPDGCAGHRLWKLCPEGTSRRQYLDAFERRNLLRAREWAVAEARRAAEQLIPTLDGRLVLVLGTSVRSAMGLPRVHPLTEHAFAQRGVAFRWIALPHPSGGNLWYNNPENQQRTMQLLGMLMNGVWR